MAPFVPRKRHRSQSPAPAQSAVKRGKPTVFDALDAASNRASAADTKAFLDALGGSDSDSELSDADSDESEHVMNGKAAGKAGGERRADKQEHGEDDEDEMDWEDALPPPTDTALRDTPQAKLAPWQRGAPDASDILEVTLGGPLNEEDESARKTALGIKGPSKKDRQLRIWTHCVHVQLLLYHNVIRNGWTCDKEVQKILMVQLPEGVKSEVRRWRRDSGLPPDESLEPEIKAKGKKGGNETAKGKGKGKEKASRQSDRNQRDWGAPAERTEEGNPNLSHGDPILKLLKYLAAYWKKRFRITAPGFRKRGYFPTAKSLAAEVKAWKSAKGESWEKGKGVEPQEYDMERFGEEIRTRDEFMETARRCEGSRDVGAQLFTALLRGLGLECRMVASLQPTGYGFTKAEDVVLNKAQPNQSEASKEEDDLEPEPEPDTKAVDLPKSTDEKKPKPVPAAQGPIMAGHTRSSGRTSGTKAAPINIDDSDSGLSSAPSNPTNASLIDVTPSKPVSRPNNKRYDTDLSFPIYWTEVLSPITHAYIPVSPLVISTVASTPDLLSAFEPRGVAAEKAKQVICYVVAFSADGTAKDVTVRYLKKRIWPGKTKGFRLPVEKIPVYNRAGKVKKYEEYDWFKRVMSGYARDGRARTEADEIEDDGDLVPVKPTQAKKNGGEETLQGYKNSAEFVLERHLRREEAIRPGSGPVKTFIAGKGDKAKPEPVFKRADVVACKTVETWHKEGRQILPGEQPMKRVPSRAVTLVRKLENEQAERETGEKVMQGLYAEEQTEWIIPPPIRDGKIPRNAFGNIDIYVPTMVPQGAVHVPLRGTARICKKLEIDFAEACTGFEFGNRRAVPVLTGVVVAEENADLVREAWRAQQKAQREKENKKREEQALKMWRRFLLGLRIVERVKEEYGEGQLAEKENPFAKKKRVGELANTFEKKGDDDMDGGGGFLPEDGDVGPGGFFSEGHEEEEVGEGGFIRDGEEDVGDDVFIRDGEDAAAESGGFIIEQYEKDVRRMDTETLTATGGQEAPISLQSAHQNLPKPTADGATAEEDSEEESDDEVGDEVSPLPPARGRGRGRGRARGRAARVMTTRKRRRKSSGTMALDGPTETDSDSVSDALSPVSPDASPPSPSAGADHDAGSAADDRKSKPARKGNGEDEDEKLGETPRSVPKRRAARNSATALRSHYFQPESSSSAEGEEDGEGAGEEEAGRKKATPARRGGRGRGGSGRGRGRGRGKGRT